MSISSLVLVLSRITSRIFLAIPIILSHDPAMWDAWGGLKVHLALLAERNFLTGPDSTKTA